MTGIRRTIWPAVGIFLCALLLGAQGAGAQAATRIYRVGWLGSSGGKAESPALDALRLGMRDLGYVEGKTFIVIPRWWNGRREELSAVVDDLLLSRPDVIVAQGAAAILAGKDIARVPVVFSISSDPPSAGIVQSLAHPGGNMTGRTIMSLEINGKRLELIHEALPHIRQVALMYNTKHAGEHLEQAENAAAARRLGLTIDDVQAATAADIDGALARIKAAHDEAVIVLPDSLLLENRSRIIAFASRNRLPLVSGWSDFARSGALMTYGPNQAASYRQLAAHVDKILKGARPADIPVERPTVFELVVNLGTAKALGIDVPQSILVRADDVIE